MKKISLKRQKIRMLVNYGRIGRILYAAILVITMMAMTTQTAFSATTVWDKATRLLMSRQDKVRIGYRYRLYFKNTDRLTLGCPYLEAALSSDCFIGFEELGEFQSQKA